MIEIERKRKERKNKKEIRKKERRREKMMKQVLLHSNHIEGMFTNSKEVVQSVENNINYEREWRETKW